MQPRLYTDLASWWPVISPPSEYEEEAAFVVQLFEDSGTGVSTVLELGSGGGHNAYHLARSFDMTLVDVSPAMLAQSRLLNRDCEHIVGDMRTVRLDRRFDGVFLHDAVDYMVTEENLSAALATAHLHLRSGGILVVAPDHTTETFRPGTEHGGGEHPDGRSARYLEWSHEASGCTVEVDYVFVLRHPSGDVEVVHDRHVTGLYTERRWLELLDLSGFDAEVIGEPPTGIHEPRKIFRARRR